MRRALILAPLALALSLAACGDDDDDPADTASASTKPETTEGGGITVPDISIPDISIPDISIPDITIPDISLPDISIPDISIPDVSLPENADELFRQVFPNLDDDQIDCLVENMSGDIDVSVVTELLDECNIDPQDLLPGG
jgi:hypothetical protein